MAGVLCSMVGASFVTAVAEVIRRKAGIAALGNAQISTAQSQFGGTSALFDGTDDRLIPTGSSLTMASDFTFEFWLRCSNVASPESQHFWINPDADYTIQMSGTGGALIVYDGANRSIGTLSNTTWTHFAIVRSGSTMQCYLNGTAAGSSWTNSNTTKWNFNNATLFNRSNNLAAGFNGHIDEVRLSNSARYTANFTPSTTPFQNDANTVLLLHCDGTNASTFFEDDNGVRRPKAIRRLGNGSISTAQSKFGGSSLDLSGTTNTTALRGAYTADLSVGTGDFTIETWVRFTGTEASNGFNQIYGQWVNPYVTLFYVWGTIGSGSQQQMILQLNNAVTSSTANTTGLFALNVWYHIAVTRSSGTIRFFKDGTQVTTTSNATNTQNLTGVSDFGIGYNIGADTQKLVGFLDELRVSNNARYTANFTPSTTPFVNDANTLLLLHMDGTSGSTVFRDDNGIGRAQKACIAVGQAQIDNAQSQFGGTSALFDGSDSRVQIQDHPDFALGTGDFTVEGWYRFHTSANRYNTIFNGSSNAVFPHVFTSTSGDSPPNRFVFVGGSTPDIIQGTQTWAINQWYHIALSRSSGTTRLFINGTLEGSVANSANYTGSAVNIGASSTLTSDLMGWVDEFRISNIARYTANFTPSTTPFQNDANTLVLLHMDGTDASTVFIDDNGTRPT